MEAQEQCSDHRPASFGGGEAGSWTSWSPVQYCCAGYLQGLARLRGYFLKAPAAAAAPPPPTEVAAGDAGGRDSEIVHVQPRSFQFERNQNQIRGIGGSGGIKY